jgi:threonine synthase
MVCIATASPAKFPEAFHAVGLAPQSHPVIDNLQKMPAINKVPMERSSDWVQFLKDFIETKIPPHF